MSRKELIRKSYLEELLPMDEWEVADDPYTAWLEDACFMELDADYERFVEARYESYIDSLYRRNMWAQVVSEVRWDGAQYRHYEIKEYPYQ